MPINNITGFPSSQAQQRSESSQVQVGRNEPSAKQQETGRPSTVDTVSLTDTSARLRQMENTLAQLPVVDNQRVEAIRRALAEGTFETDPERIAEKMVAMEKELDR
jgi:negative regulator of flagellin synthesis FlgM